MTGQSRTGPGGAPDVSGQQRRTAVVRRMYSAAQAIRDTANRTVGYELFYRDSAAATTATERTSAATLAVLDRRAANLTGELADSRLYFVNVTREFLVGSLPLPASTQIAVAEVQPDVVVDPQVVAGIIRLRNRDIGVALDRYLPGRPQGQDRLLPLVSHVKIDMMGHDAATLQHAVEVVRRSSAALVVGTRIGTPDLLELARRIGCDLFQGYALDDAGTVAQDQILGSLRSYVELMGMLAGDDVVIDLARLAEVVMRDADLSLRLVKACRSAAVGISQEITSVHHAVRMLGLAEIRRQVQLALAQGLRVAGEDQLTRIAEYAMLTDLVGIELGVTAGTGFLVGLVTEVADVLDRPVSEIADRLPLGSALLEGLRGRTGGVGRALAVVEAHKREEPSTEFAPALVAALHLEAVRFATGISRAADTPDPAVGPAELSLPPLRSVDEFESLFGLAPSWAEVESAILWNAQSRAMAEQRFVEASVPLVDLPDREEAAIRHVVDGVPHYPRWQFGDDDRLISGVVEVAGIFPGDAVSLSEWMNRPCPGLSSRQPLTALADGDIAQVVCYVRGMTAW